MQSNLRTWPRYKIIGDTVVDTWTSREIMAVFGGSKRDRRRDVERTRSRAEYAARCRVARLRRIILTSSGIAIRLADRVARDLDAAGIGRFDHWFAS